MSASSKSYSMLSRSMEEELKGLSELLPPKRDPSLIETIKENVPISPSLSRTDSWLSSSSDEIPPSSKARSRSITLFKNQKVTVALEMNDSQSNTSSTSSSRATSPFIIPSPGSNENLHARRTISKDSELSSTVINPPFSHSTDSIRDGDLSKHIKLKIFVVTWNMKGKPPPDEELAFIPVNQFDFYAIGTQECERSIGKSMVIPPRHQKWEEKLITTFGSNYMLLKTEALGSVHLSIFVRTELFHAISNVQSDGVTCGLGNVLNNKGGVGISFTFGSQSFCFVNCHLTAHDRNVLLRNADYKRISYELKLSPYPEPLSSEDYLKPVHERFQNVFWFGDLNYRIGGKRSVIEMMIEMNRLDVLIANDQLTKQKKSGEIFQGYLEGSLLFRPTYKYDESSDNYDSSKKARVPSWTDRILFKNNDRVTITEYNCFDLTQYSDHRPVFAHFEVYADSLASRNDVDNNSEGSKVCNII